MKKIFTFMMALVTAVTMSAVTQVTFDFSDASAYGYANPEKGKFTQVENGAVLTKGDVTKQRYVLENKQPGLMPVDR